MEISNVTSILVVIVLILAAFVFGKELLETYNTKEKRIAALKQWLKYAVVQAEEEFGSKTGKLKLQYVYNLAVSEFSWITVFVSFENFSAWVDEALVWMAERLEENSAIAAYIKG